MMNMEIYSIMIIMEILQLMLEHSTVEMKIPHLIIRKKADEVWQLLFDLDIIDEIVDYLDVQDEFDEPCTVVQTFIDDLVDDGIDESRV